MMKRMNTVIGRRFSVMALAAAVSLAAVSFGPVPAFSDTDRPENETGGENMIATGDFESSLDGWGLYLEGGKAEIAINDDHEMELRISSVGRVDYGVQDYYDGFSLTEGCVYTLEFDVRSDLEREITWRAQLNGGDYHAYANDNVLVGPEEQHVTATFTMNEPTDPAPRFCFNCGVSEGYTEGDPAHVITFDNVSLVMIDDSNSSASEGAEESACVTLSQAGYLPDSVKTAVVRGSVAEDADRFAVINTDSGETVLEKAAGEAVFNEVSGETVRVLDFSEITEDGQYEIKAGGESAGFEIGESVLDDLTESVVHFFETQVCGEELSEGDYSHPACHTADAVLYEDPGESRDVAGGWHDAGDYGRYTVPAAKACADLLLAYEDFGQDGRLEKIPEIVRHELEWLLKMQDDDGGARHKVTCETFPGAVSPDLETDQLYLFPASTAATGDFAAVMAIAARVYGEGKIDEDFAQRCLDAALKAEEWLAAHPSDDTGFKNPESVLTGEYGDSCDTDERFWAAAELQRTTGQAGRAEELIPKIDDVSFGWADVSGYGLYAAARGADPDSVLFNAAAEKLRDAADLSAGKSDADAYGAALGTEDYVWGSNMGAANQGMLFLLASRITRDESYTRYAEKQLNYLLGNNTNGICYVTGYGSSSPEHPHHRPSQAAGEAVSGMLVGGPDSNLEDPYAQNVLSDHAPAACYADSDQSYSTNEVAIYWNSPMVYLLAGTESE